MLSLFRLNGMFILYIDFVPILVIPFFPFFPRFQFILIHPHSRVLALAMESKQKSSCIILNLFDETQKRKKIEKIFENHVHA